MLTEAEEQQVHQVRLRQTEPQEQMEILQSAERVVEVEVLIPIQLVELVVQEEHLVAAVAAEVPALQRVAQEEPEDVEK
jgi:hypothetical protein